MADRLKDIPTLDRNLANLQAVADAVQEAIQTLRGLRGEPLDKAVTWRDLNEQGLVDLDVLNRIARGRAPGSIILPRDRFDPPDDDIDLTPPPTPTGLTVTAGIAFLIIECDAALYTQGHGHDRTIVYGAKWADPSVDPEPVFSDAVPICEFQGTVFAYATDPATTWCIWIKWKSVDGVLSVAPAGGTNGGPGDHRQDVRLLLDALTRAANDPTFPYSKFAVRAGLFYVTNDATSIDQPVFSVVTVPFTNNGVPVPVGVYARDLFVMNGTITNAKIANLAVDDAKIANLSVGKLTAGSIAVGEHIQSTGFVSGSAGWRIRGNGSAEFSGVIVRGTIYASAGAIGGAQIDSDGIQSAGYIPGSAGWRIDNTTQIAEFQNIIARGDITANRIRVGSSPTISGTTMTGSGAVINDDGTFAIGNATGNATFDGSVLTLNGEVVASGNLTANSATRIYTQDVGAWGVAKQTVTITSADIPAGETTVAVIVTSSVDALLPTFFDIGVNQGPAWTTAGNLLAALPPNAGVQSYSKVYQAVPGTYEFASFNHGAGDAADAANTRNRSVIVQVCLR